MQTSSHKEQVQTQHRLRQMQSGIRTGAIPGCACICEYRRIYLQINQANDLAVLHGWQVQSGKNAIGIVGVKRSAENQEGGPHCSSPDRNTKFSGVGSVDCKFSSKHVYIYVYICTHIYIYIYIHILYTYIYT